MLIETLFRKRNELVILLFHMIPKFSHCATVLVSDLTPIFPHPYSNYFWSTVRRFSNFLAQLPSQPVIKICDFRKVVCSIRNLFY